MIIRDMEINDLDQVMALEKHCFSVPWSRESFKSELTTNKLAHYIVLEIEGMVSGYAGVWYITDEGHITNVCIHKKYRKLGFGKKVVDFMIEKAKINKINHMTLEVRKSNISAIKLYEKKGFKIAGVRSKYYSDNNEDALIMWLKL